MATPTTKKAKSAAPVRNAAVRAAEAIRVVKFEKTAWEDAVCYVTDRVAFNMRNVIRQARKNYYGIFDKPVDPNTGRDKVWVPLTEVLVEGNRKNIDLDTKDANVRAKRPGAEAFSFIVRNILRNGLEKMRFGEILDDLILRLCIDGTVVAKVEKSASGFPTVATVDLLNFYIEPTAHSIAETPAVIERIVLPVSEFNALAARNQWLDIKDIATQKNINLTDVQQPTANQGGDTDFVELYRRVGLTQRQVLTGNPDDTDLVSMEVICSATKGNWVFHASALRKDNSKKGYQETWFVRVPSRWYGRGVPEKLFMLQGWANTTVNVRINRSIITQLGIFKVRKGRGIKPQDLSRLPSNGAVLVNDMTDLEQLTMQDIPVSSYKDEEVIWNWGQRSTAAYDAAIGGNLPSSMPATNAAIQNQASQSQFVLSKEQLGMFLERLIGDELFPELWKQLKQADFIRLMGDADEIRALDETLVNCLLYDEIEKANKAGTLLDPMQIELERRSALEKLQKMGEARYFKGINILKLEEYEVKFYFTNEEFDSAVVVDKLFNALKLVQDPAKQEQLIQSALDLMGLPPLKQSMAPTLPQPVANAAGAPGAPQPAGPGTVPQSGPNLQQLTTSANVPS